MYLNCKTFFSFRYGVLSAEQLISEAAEAGARALALTNINSTADHWDFFEACNTSGIKPMLGTEIRNDSTFMYILIAKNIIGVREINSFLTSYLQPKNPFPAKPHFDNTWVIYPYHENLLIETLEENEMIGIKPSEINKLYNAQKLLAKCVIRQPVTYKDKKGYNIHRLLRAIDKNIVLSKQLTTDIAGTDELFLSSSAILERFSQYPVVVTNTLRVIDTCNYQFTASSDKNKKTFSATLEDDRNLLKKLAFEGCRKRFGQDKEAVARVEKELKIINQLGFNAYFLITWDIIRYAQNRGFYHVGRGSGANSIVAYCLQITDVNPIDLDLYFERFLNPYRTSPPDFDIDFSWKDRDEVIDYVFKRYGKEHVALLGMYSTFQYRAVIRELGKVFGLPKAEIDSLVINNKAALPDDSIQQQILFYGKLMQNFPNYVSIHPGGMLITEEPISQYTTLEMPPKGFATTQIDMFIAEKIGLYKLDILSQRGLGHIKEATRLIKENRSITVDIHDVERFKKDPVVAAQIRAADTIGCFYIESPAMRQLLKKLRCDDYLTLVAASSIIRPGVSQSGMMREYIYRFHNPGKFEYIHPKMEELLRETYGVMVYQEDVIKVAHHFAGLDMGEADVLRRAMSGKYRGRKEFEAIRDKFFLNCKERHYPDNITSEVWRQIESFGGYSFSKAHSASFAVESYQSLFLKTYYPMEFMVAVINNFGGFYSTELYFHELKRSGAKVSAPCVNQSDDLTNIRGKDVYIGLIHVQNLEQETKEMILHQRSMQGSYISLQDFIERTGVGMEQLNILIRVGALRFTGKSKKALLWEANFLRKKLQGTSIAARLFAEPVIEFKLPTLSCDPYEDALDEIELLGFPLCPPFDLAESGSKNYIQSNQFSANVGKVVDVLGYYITEKPVRTIKGEYMCFGTFIDSKGDWIDSVHFPQSAVRFPLAGKGFYHMQGNILEEFGVYTFDVTWMKKIGMKVSKEA